MTKQHRFTLLLPLALTSLLTGCAAHRQTASEVAIRGPGERSFRPPEPLVAEARADREFAWLAEAAYGHTVDAETKSKAALQADPACRDPERILEAGGWTLWTDFPSDGLRDKFKKTNLRAEVWSRKNPSAVAVAFGGTVFSNWKDWLANLRWFIPIHNDEYTAVVTEFGPAFVAEYQRLANLPAWSYLKDATLYATGHSLGGGLAQEFAYSLPPDATVPRVAKVYAFDPSPVTGFYSAEARTRDINKEALQIDRIYERGEVLAYIRSITNFVAPPPASSPAVRTIRYNFVRHQNPVDQHSIRELACGIELAVRQATTEK